jgi:hypothetical protein
MANDEWIPKPGEMRVGGDYCPLTVGEIRAAIAELDDEIEIDFGCTMDGAALLFFRWKWRGEKLLQIELNEDFLDDHEDSSVPFLTDDGADNDGQVN